MAALLFPIIGIAVVWFAGEMTHTTSDAVLVTLLLTPVAIYLIGTERLKELSGPGGISIKLAETVTAPIQATQQMIWATVEEIQQVQKGDLRSLRNTLAQQDLTKTTVLVVRAGGDQGPYSVSALQEYVRHLSSNRNFKLVAITDDTGRFEASITPSALRYLLNSPLARSFIDYLNGSLQIERAHRGRSVTDRFPALVKQFCTPQHTNAEVLALMRDLNLHILAVVDPETREIVGVVERDRIVTSILLAAEPDTS